VLHRLWPRPGSRLSSVLHRLWPRSGSPLPSVLHRWWVRLLVLVPLSALSLAQVRSSPRLCGAYPIS
jgi:hypothetical protein